MRNPNQYNYPIGKKRMQQVGIIVFASVMATLGLQILLESGRELVNRSHPETNSQKEKWMIGIMVSVTVIKFPLMVYCRRFKNEIVRAYAQDHLFDVITNSVGLVTVVLAIQFHWWIDLTGAIIIASYTISTWAKTFTENYMVTDRKNSTTRVPSKTDVSETMKMSSKLTLLKLTHSDLITSWKSTLSCQGTCYLAKHMISVKHYKKSLSNSQKRNWLLFR